MAAGSRPAASQEGMIMMVMGADKPGTIKIKATIAADEVDIALAAYHLPGSTGRSYEIYFCEPDPQRPSCVATWNAAELKSATGRPWQ